MSHSFLDLERRSMSKVNNLEPNPNILKNFDDFERKMIPVSKLVIKHANAQRNVSDTHAKNIARNLDPDKFGSIEVTLPDGRGLHHVIDGFNRIKAVRMLWGPDQMVPCNVRPVDSKDAARAAEIFLGLNKGRKPVKPVDNFRVSVTAKHPDEVAINKVVESCGYKVSSTHANGTIAAVGALKSVYTMYGPEVLKSALTIIQATWGHDQNALVGSIIMGYGAFLAHFGDKVNWGRLKSVIQKNFTPGSLLGAAKNVKVAMHISITEAMVEVLYSNYNRGLKKKDYL